MVILHSAIPIDLLATVGPRLHARISHLPCFSIDSLCFVSRGLQAQVGQAKLEPLRSFRRI